jgi:hypothetical protein
VVPDAPLAVAVLIFIVFLAIALLALRRRYQ